MAQFSSMIEVLASLRDQRLTAQFSSATEVLGLLKDQCLTAQFSSATVVFTSPGGQYLAAQFSSILKSTLHLETNAYQPSSSFSIEVLILLGDQRLAVQSIFTSEVPTLLGDQVSVRSGIKTPSGDSDVDTSHPCRPKVSPPKGYDHSTIQVRQDLNNLFISIVK